MKIKKIIILILLLLTPLKIKAEEIEATIKINNELKETNNQNITFTYELTDLEGNIIQTKESKEKEVLFDTIKFTEEDENKIYYYIIKQKELNKEQIEYDKEPIYVGIEITKEENILKANVSYIKPSNYLKQEPRPFHAKEEELTGEAYAEYDKDTQTLTFFRDEPGKYTNYQVIGNKAYFTGIEEENSDLYQWHIPEPNEYYFKEIKKIITKDPIKPKNIMYMFQELENVTEVDISKLDTSEITDLTRFFSNAKNLKELDISTMDTSNVTNMSYMFNGSGIEKLDFTLWDMSKVEDRHVESALTNMPNLKYLDISNWGPIDSSAELANLQCLEVAKLGNRYKFSRTRLARGGDKEFYFLKLEDKRLYNVTDITIPYNIEVGTIGGTYIRAACTKEASFINKYIERNEINNQNTNTQNKEKELINPQTGTLLKILIITSITITSIIIILKTKKKVDN